MDAKPFLIAGGGIAGLAASLGLARIGQAARVFEQHPVFEEVGAGLQMSPNGVRALQWLGAWEAVEPHCVTPSEIHVRDGRSGALLQRIRLGKPFEDRFGAPYRVAHRADLLGGLVAAAKQSRLIELNTACTVASADVADDGASLSLAGGRTETGPAVIAADGIHSKLRRQFWPSSVPAYRGHAIHRALIPFQAVPPEIAADCVTLWLYPGGHVVHYAVSNWRQFNIVAAIDSPWTATGWREAANGTDLRIAFADAADPLASLLAAPHTWIKWAGADLAPLDSWSVGNLTLIGDAAHAALPYLAQGAVMSLEDACVLAAMLRQDPRPAAAFAAYADARKGRTSRIQAQSRQLGMIYHAKGMRAAARNLSLRLLGETHAVRRHEWIYGWTRE
jgi:2-polyprenyl-6-methoxyphenol hydroxylase-like FAD-dependent oxidoreductase